eukprot:7540982-Alexandrium_andersonii.AAC.1
MADIDEMAVTASWMVAWRPTRSIPTPQSDHAYLVATDAAEAVRRSWTCTPAALANLPDRVSRTYAVGPAGWNCSSGCLPPSVPLRS